LLDDGCPQLEDGVDYEAMGLNWHWGLVMPLAYYPGIMMTAITPVDFVQSHHQYYLPIFEYLKSKTMAVMLEGC